MFTWAGSCACGHDLYPILHTWSQFIPTAGRTSGISIFFPTVLQLVKLSVIFPCSCKKVDSALHLVQRWLVRAKEHLRTYLQEQQGRTAGRRKSQVNSFRKMMSSSDVSRLF